MMYHIPSDAATVTRSVFCPWSDHLQGKRWLILVGLSICLVTAYALLYRRRRWWWWLWWQRDQHQQHLEVTESRQLYANGEMPTRPNGKRPRQALNGKPSDCQGPDNPRSLLDTYAWNGKEVDIGAVLGVDIGGTLSKLVYFEKKAPSVADAKLRTSEDPIGKKVEMKRTRSLGNLHDTTEQQEALEEFYTFMDHASELGETGVRDSELSVYSHALGGCLHFFHFETRYMDNALGIITKSKVHRNIQAIGCTGGGAYKFEELFLRRLVVKMLKMDEMECLVRGLQFALANIPEECYTYRPPSETENGDSKSREGFGGEEEGSGENGDSGWAKDNLRNERMRHMAEASSKREYTVKVRRTISDEPANKNYPALIVSLGSGVSIIKVDGPAEFKRVSGSSIGGGTYWGLCRLLTEASSYEDSLRMASRGKSDKVDMLVGDIYGEGYNKFQLSSNTLASSFGRIGGLRSPKGPGSGISENDLARSLLVMITMNIGQVAYLNARLFNTRHIYFVGNFLRQNHLSGQQLAFAIDYWSSGEMEALFLEHEGYCGALGAFLMSGTEESPGTTRSSDNKGD